MFKWSYPVVLLLLLSCSKPEEKLDVKMEEARIHQLMDSWHQAASVADEETFFGTMSEDAIYLGTDKNERWDKSTFMEWSEPYFQRDTAWSFHSHDRTIYFSTDAKNAWFEESLDTWMGPCRGSGVLEWANGEWKLTHYNLAMCIDNDDVDAVLRVIQPDSLLPPD